MHPERFGKRMLVSPERLVSKRGGRVGLGWEAAGYSFEPVNRVSQKALIFSQVQGGPRRPPCNR